VQLNLVIILDEIEHLCPPNSDEVESTEANEAIPQFFGVLRKLIQELDNFDFVVAGLASAVVESGELYGRHNPLFRLANAHYLSPFTRDEAAELLQGIGSRLGMNWKGEAISSAYDETGGQVVLLRELAAHVWELKRQDTLDWVIISANDIENVIVPYRRSVLSLINETIDHVKRYYPAEYELCGELMSSPADFAELAEAYPVEANRLINLGLIVENDSSWSPTQMLRLGRVERSRPKATTFPAMRSLNDLILQGEHRTLEFKSSVRVPLDQEVAEIVVVEALVKAILGFLNADGGTILVGVADDGTPIGLESDIKHSGNSRDQLLRYVVDKLNSYLGQSVCSTIAIDWHEIDAKDILIFEVPRSEKPVFPSRKVGGREDLFVRQSANVVPFSGVELYNYITRRFTS
jgi:hypothetical protein